jgi:lipopolysaccharide transport system ATP-binding protein
LLKLLSQITKPTEGTIRINGRVASLLEVGTGFHPELTGRENIFLNGTILGMTRAEVSRKFDEIVAFSGVEKFIDTPVKHYSSGMYVRLAFSVAAHLEPEILIIDEVLAVGDAEFQQKCLGKMKSIAGEGRTVIFVSHNLAAVKELCQKGIVIEKGELIFHGESSAAIQTYQSSHGSQSHYENKTVTTDKTAVKAIALCNQALQHCTEFTYLFYNTFFNMHVTTFFTHIYDLVFCLTLF